MTISKSLQFHRNLVGLTQQQVAQKLGITRQSISKWENNRGYPDIENLIRLSEVYQVSVDKLLKEKEW
ncbi:transcriptional regulator with XRE-family HTH domain [Enterococcus rivorum]|uniref:HTH cro/C1-type domain-containing protein n=1 Tax=Enterococcus rivorum TaxID=762845 RepID=A0A1E5KXI3_9ENTE|nr:helix-turn-helix transcriptional regulator [Enterococcus rivorum]MBP2097279.1 transcriptional regulator with XRE-family HTH domain [Enterococcus rivorum]OEH82369.1 hypothetical protein BCR26_02760 [Enterococcus rivorum]